MRAINTEDSAEHHEPSFGTTDDQRVGDMARRYMTPIGERHRIERSHHVDASAVDDAVDPAGGIGGIRYGVVDRGSFKTSQTSAGGRAASLGAEQSGVTGKHHSPGALGGGQLCHSTKDASNCSSHTCLQTLDAYSAVIELGRRENEGLEAVQRFTNEGHMSTHQRDAVTVVTGLANRIERASAWPFALDGADIAVIDAGGNDGHTS